MKKIPNNRKAREKEMKKALNRARVLIIASKTSRITAFILSFVFFGWKLALIVFLFLIAIEIDNKLNKNLNI